MSTASKIMGFGLLPEGWHYGEGVLPSDEVISKAIEIESLYRELGFEETDAIPSIDGWIEVTAYSGRHYIETVIAADMSYEVAHEIDDVEVDDRTKMDEHAARRMIRSIGEQIKRPTE